MNRIFCIVAIALGSVAFAADAPQADQSPRSPAALAAKVHYTASVKDAKAAYTKAMIAADQKYIDELNDALRAAMQGGVPMMDEAKRIDAARLAAVAQLKGDEANPEKPTTMDWLIGTRWKFNGTDTLVEYRAGGVVASTAWASTERWSVLDQTTIIQLEPSGERVKVTMSSDHTACLWQYENARHEPRYAIISK